MSRKLSNYIRTFRKRLGLTQHDVAFLTGYHDGSKVSGIERQRKLPSLRAVIALSIIFHVKVYELFPQMYTEVEEAVTKQAQVLSQKLSDKGLSILPVKRVRHIRSLASERTPVPHKDQWMNNQHKKLS